jgi:polysaccharide export outer membrane protein
MFQMIVVLTLGIGPGRLEAQPAPYAVGPGDVLQITIYAGGDKQEEFTDTVSPAGTINCPLVGEVRAGGMTPPKIAERLRERLARDYYRDPQVLVSLKEYGGQIHILGEVRRPGLYPFRAGLTALSACALAGGFGDFAAAQRARVTRSVDGRSKVFEVNLIRVKQGKAEDLPLACGDRIDVPRRRF